MSNKLLALLAGDHDDKDQQPWYELTDAQKTERLHERQKKTEKFVRFARACIGFLIITGGTTFVMQFASAYRVRVEPAVPPSNPSYVMGADRAPKPDAGP